MVCNVMLALGLFSNNPPYKLNYYFLSQDQSQCSQPADASAPSYANRNVINSETPYINANLQLSEKTQYVSMKPVEVDTV